MLAVDVHVVSYCHAAVTSMLHVKQVSELYDQYLSSCHF
jgi:hypothetical protein